MLPHILSTWFVICLILQHEQREERIERNSTPTQANLIYLVQYAHCNCIRYISRLCDAQCGPQINICNEVTDALTKYETAEFYRFRSRTPHM